MENSKFNKIYTENINNIITEKYHRKIGFWNADKASKSVASMLKDAIKDEYVNEFNDSFVPKKWFNFKKIFKSKPEIEISSFGASNCKIRLLYTIEMNQDETFKLVYGDSKKGKLLPFLESPKPGGLIFNDNLKQIFVDAGFKDPSPVIDFEKLKLDTAPFEKNFKVIFSFNKITYVDNVKPSKRLNPNYIKSIKGNIYFSIKGSEVQVGTCEYFQKRFANMDPPKPLKDQIKDMWDKPNKDFGLLGSLVSKGIGAATTGLTGGLFSKTVQEENFDITLNEKYTYSNNIAGGDIDTRNSNNSDYIETRLNDLFKKIASELGDDSLVGFSISRPSETKYLIILDVNKINLMQIVMEVK
jgi:hypothetical protein